MRSRCLIKLLGKKTRNLESCVSSHKEQQADINQQNNYKGPNNSDHAFIKEILMPS